MLIAPVAVPKQLAGVGLATIVSGGIACMLEVALTVQLFASRATTLNTPADKPVNDPLVAKVVPPFIE
jgi:hypothetical protein